MTSLRRNSRTMKFVGLEVFSLNFMLHFRKKKLFAASYQVTGVFDTPVFLLLEAFE